jgi:phosphate uptake regulator
MLRELLAIFRGGKEPLEKMGENFREMLNLAVENSLKAGETFFEGRSSAETRSEIYEKDVQINKLERKIRKRVAAHLSIHGNRPDVPYCLLLMSLVKDIERIGDYAKNLAELVEIYQGSLPDDDIFQELREARREVEEAFRAAHDIFAAQDRERAIHFIQTGRDVAHRCDTLIIRVANSDYPAGLATAAVLCSRYYKRFGGHILNIFSSVVMPLHKIDYYDEDVVKALEEADKASSQGG